MMKSAFLESQFSYDGTQLQPLYAHRKHGLEGDSVVAWVGPCRIAEEHMIDLEDLLEGSKIQGDLMLHFIVECFDATLFEMVGLQRLFASIALESLRSLTTGSQSTTRPIEWSQFRREGDDLYFDFRAEPPTRGSADPKNTRQDWRPTEGKLSISIASRSVVSGQLHFAMNVVNDGTPVRTASLKDLGLDPKAVALEVLKRFALEYDSIQAATRKVKPLT